MLVTKALAACARPRRAAPAARRRRHRQPAAARRRDRASGCRGRHGAHPAAVAVHRQRRDDRRARRPSSSWPAVPPSTLALRRRLDAAGHRDPGRGGGARERPDERMPRPRRRRSPAATAATRRRRVALAVAAAVEPPSPDVALADEASPLPGAHRGGFQRLPTAPVAVTTESAPAEPGTDATRREPAAQWLMPPTDRSAPRTRGLGAGVLDRRTRRLAVRRLGLPDRAGRRRLGDPGAAPPAREPRRRGLGARARRRLGALQRRLAARSPRAARTSSADVGVATARLSDRWRRTRSARIATRFAPMRVRNSVADSSPRSLSLRPERARGRHPPRAS